MKATAQANKIRATVTACIFCGLLFVLFLLLCVLPDKEFSDTEKRVLAEFPKPTVSSVFKGDFTSKIESYIQDQMPMRNFFVGLSAGFNYRLGQNGTDGLYIAKDDYIINTPVKDNDRNLSSNLRFLCNFAKKQDIPAYMMIVPQTGYIHEDKLPKRHSPYKDDVWMKTITKETADTYSVVDLRTLFKSETDRQLYYRTDHHWTSYGAFLAANAFLNAAGKTPLTENMFEVKDVPGFFGTTYSKAALWQKPSDTMSLWHAKDADYTVEISDLGKDDVTKAKDVFFEEHLEKYDMYPTYLNGNHSFTHIVNTSVPDGVLLMIKDSFGNTLATELSAAYREIIMVDMRYYRTAAVSDLIDQYNVDTILVNYSMDSIVGETNILWLK